MHELFAQVLTRKDLSKAGELFSLEDTDIRNDLTEVLERICEIAKSPEYASSDNDQSVVEICITRVTSAIRETQSIEENAAGLVKLLEVCHTHNLKPCLKDTDPPHAKIASDIMSCLFMHYGKENVMRLAIPVAVKFLSCDHKELSHNVSSYLSLAAIDNADMLAKYMDLIVSSILKGKCALARVLPQIFAQNSEPVIQNVDQLIDMLEKCGVSERVSLLQVFGMIAKSKPRVLEKHISIFCKYTSVSTLLPLILTMFIDLATANPIVFVDHVTTLKEIAEQQPVYIQQVVQIIGALGTVSQVHAVKTMNYLVSLLSSLTDQSALVVILQEIKAIGLLHHNLLADNIADISKLSQCGSSAVRILVHQLKDDHKKYCGQKEMRSVSSQTEGTVTIITVGNPAYPSNVVGVRQQQQPNSARSSQQSLSKASRNSSSNVRASNDRPVSPASTLDRASLNSALTLSSNSGLPPEPVRDGVQHFCEKHLNTIRNFISSLSARIPLPAKCSIVDGRHKRYVRLNFQCGINGKHCLYGKQYFTLNTKLPKTWIHLMFLAVQAQSPSALSQQDVNVSSLKACWDALYPEKGYSGYLTLVTSSFPVAKEQDALLQEMHNVRYFDVFEFNAPKKYWACFMCNHPEKTLELMPDGSPIIAGQLKEKKGRWKFLKRWKTRYFTLSGSQITYSKSDSRKETLPVREIQSVKAVRKGIRDIPKAFEIFTTDQNYIFKAKGQQNIEPWVQCIHLAVAKANDEGTKEHEIVEDMMLQRPRTTVRDTKL